MKFHYLVLGTLISCHSVSLELQLSAAQCQNFLAGNNLILDRENRKQITKYCRINYKSPNAIKQCEAFTAKGMISDLTTKALNDCQLIVQNK